MEDAFAALYRGLLARIEPDPLRLRRGLRALFPSDGAQTAEKLLQSAEKRDIDSERDTDEHNVQRAGNEA